MGPRLSESWGQDKQLWSSSNNWSYRSWISHINDWSSYSRSSVPYKDWWKIPSAKNEKTVQVSENGLEIQMLATGWSFITALSDIGDAVSTLEKSMSIKEKLVGILDRWEEWATSHVPWNTHFKDVIFRIELESDKKRAARLSADYDLIYGKAGARKVLTPACVDVFERELFPRIHGCQLYTTEDGAIGIVASNCGAQIGDEIKFLRRGLTHFVVRKKDRGYQLISPCYHALVTPRGWEERITLI
ncbi:hypothetical protein B0J14DRAFT_653977 [Halenospora varia]|nr:hypothetical protein B0J14DRAFT_653977 [Halenospora varia]